MYKLAKIHAASKQDKIIQFKEKKISFNYVI